MDTGTLMDDKEPRINVKHTWHPKIISGELYMLTTYSFSVMNSLQHRCNDAVTLQETLSSTGFYICNHVAIDDHWSNQGVAGLDRIWTDAAGTCEPERASCNYCKMDYEVVVPEFDVSNTNRTREPFLFITVWRRLGTCRTPDCEVWRRTIDLTYQLTDKVMDIEYDGLLPGAVRNRWEEDSNTYDSQSVDMILKGPASLF